MSKINESVGKGGKNLKSDVKIVQELLNTSMKGKLGWKGISPDGFYGAKTLGAIERAQKLLVKMQRPDGLVSPKGRTIRTLSVIATPKSKTFVSPVIKYRENVRPELSEYSKDILKIVMRFADITTVDISSTRRLISDQVRIMHQQLTKAKTESKTVRQIRGYGYGPAGRAVDKVFVDNVDDLTEVELKAKMEKEIETWLAKGVRTSKHVVSPSIYAGLNVFDVPYSAVPFSKRDEFEVALVSLAKNVQSRKYSKNKKSLTSLGRNLIDLVIVERRCWHIEIPQVRLDLPAVSRDMSGHC